MKTTRIGPHAHQLTFLHFSNCYLVQEADGFTLIDTSVGGCAGKIIEATRAAGGEIRRILLTHAHGDHIGSLDKLHSLLGNVDVAISEREAPLLHKNLSLRAGEPQKKPGGSFPGAKTRPTHTLTEGELFGSLRCIYTPGHTPGHMSFLDDRDGTLYAGDALVSMGGELRVVTDAPWFFPLPKVASWDAPLSVASARKLQNYNPQSFANGHGRFIGSARALGEALQHARA